MKLNLVTFGDYMADPITGVFMSQAERHHMMIDGAVAAEAAGFYGVNFGEHHAGAFAMASPVLLLSAIAARTSKLRLGTAVCLIANQDPLRVAEDFATLDVISDGRVDLVVGRGNLFAHTYDLFGQKMSDSRQLFEENIQAVLELWSGKPASFSGISRPAYKDVVLMPKPVQDPHPPLWIGGGGSAETAELAARLGLPIALPSAFSDPKRFLPIVEDYRERFASYGHKHAPQVAAFWHGNVGRDSQAVKERWRPRYETYMNWFSDQVRSQNPGWAAHKFDYDWLLSEGPALAGSPQEVIDRLSLFSEMLKADVNLIYLDMGGMPGSELNDMIGLMGTDVIPKLGVTVAA